MRIERRTSLSMFVSGLLLACLPLFFSSSACGQIPGTQSFTEEQHAGTFEEPRVLGEPAWKGAVFVNVPSNRENRFYIAAFDSDPDQANPLFPDTAQTNASWTWAGQHAGTATDLKPFDEPTRIGALHEALIEGKRALLRSKIDGTPSAQTPYPSLLESTDSWEFLGTFDRAGSVTEMKNAQDLMWPGVYVLFEPANIVYVALRSGHPATDNWPAPETPDGAAYWKYAGTRTGIPTGFAKPWGDRSTDIGSYYYQAISPLRQYFYNSTFIGFPALLGATFPDGAQSNRYWDYRGRHAGNIHDPKVFGEPSRTGDTYRAKIDGKLMFLRSRFNGLPSAQTPYPTTLQSNDYWSVEYAYTHLGTWRDPNGAEDFSWAGAIHAHIEGTTQRFFRAFGFTDNFPPASGWDYSDSTKWQALGVSVHAGTVTDPKGQDEFTWPGAVHVTTLDGVRVYFIAQVEGMPSEHDWPLPATATSTEHWTYLPAIDPLGTFEAPRQWADYSQPGSVFVDGTVIGQRTFYLSSFEGYPADEIDRLAIAGQADPNWVYAGRHAGTLKDLKPFDEPTRVGAMHEAEIAGKRALVRSLMEGVPSAATPYPVTLHSNNYWEFIGVFKHAGTASDLKGDDELTWPGALHLDETQQIVFAAKHSGEPGPTGWVYPTGEVSDDNWEFVSSIGGIDADTGTVEAPRGRNDLSTPGTIFADQRGLSRQKLYRAKFAGFAAEVGAVYPAGTESNDFYEYAGEHAGTFTDPKPFTDPTWPGAIHQTVIDMQFAFFKSKISGIPSATTPYPDKLESNESWELVFVSVQAGTYAEPKSLVGDTWPGAIHTFRLGIDDYLARALQFGNPTADGWPLPTAGDNRAHWERLGKVLHKGSFADPKQFDEFTVPGAIHVEDVEGEKFYFRSLVQGVPSANGWAYPAIGASNEHWEYLGSNSPEGTWADPKANDGFTWPGRLHSVRVGDKRLYVYAKVDGVLAEHNWPFPESGENEYWNVAGESRHSGDFADPKDQQEVTWHGAIHRRQAPEGRLYYRSKVSGNLATNNSYPLPETATSNTWWEYIGANNNAGTLDDPLSGAVLTWQGNIHKQTHDTTSAYFMARFSGVADQTHPFPGTLGQSNDDWSFLGKSTAPGTVPAPKDAFEITWPGAVHRTEFESKTYYVKSKINGVPPESGWIFPVPLASDAQWEHVDIGVHAGTWEDPKPWSDTGWPGAIYLLRRPDSLEGPNYPYRSFYSSTFWGDSSKYGLPSVGDSNWLYIGSSIAPATLSFPSLFLGTTWKGAIHWNPVTGQLFESKKNGIIANTLMPPSGPADDETWNFLGITKNSGTINAPKDWDEYTWPGRIHRYEYGGKLLFFTALMTGTPSEHGWLYPTDESSNDQWAFHGSTEHAGTFDDPHEFKEITWRNAIHRIIQPGKTIYFAARLAGNSETEQRPYPTSEADNQYWRYVATGTHAGTIEDPKDLNEPVWPGVIVKFQRADGVYYYVAKNNGIPLNNDWPLPNSDSNNEHWDFYGVSRHAGTAIDPKEWTEVTLPGDIHASLTGNFRVLFRAKKAGVPANNGWVYPAEMASDENWFFLSYTSTNGTFEKPKAWNELTEPGLIHAIGIANQTMYFAAKFSGKASADQLPNQPVDNQFWTFMRKGNGQATIPNTWLDYSLAGDINEYYINGKHLFFSAKSTGRPSSHNWYYPTSETDNTYWEYRYSHAGTPDDPKQWNELTQPGEFHLHEFAGKILFFTAKQAGNPAKNRWEYPSTGVDNQYWRYAGLHAGTRQDPKTWNEPTWPGAIHFYTEQNRYFISSVSGNPSTNNWYYPTSASSNSYWRYLDTHHDTAQGISDLSKPFDQYTWVTAHNGYLDALQPQLDRGVRGFMLDLYLDHTNQTVRMCHAPQGEQCSVNAPSLTDALNNTFLPYLRNNRNAVLTLLFESYIPREAMQHALNSVPGIAEYSYTPAQGKDNKWSTVQEMIATNKRLVMFADGRLPGNYAVAGSDVTVLSAAASQVENTYNLGNTAVTHDWSCESRYSDMPLSLRKVDGTWNRPFVLNQFHSWGSSTAHAGDKDNNLTWLQRRVERYCNSPSEGRKPNYLAIDFNQVGDALPYAAALSQGGLYFYEGNNADRDRDTVCVLPGNQPKDANGVEYDLRLKTNGCENDEIRSMELEGISAGTRIELYDSPSADKQDDFTYIDVKQSVPMGTRVRVDSLEGSSENVWYRKQAFHNNGLDGKISRIVVRTKPLDDDFSDALIVFKEGNNGSQNIVCSVPFHYSLNMKFGLSNNSFGCDNDEARSAYVTKGKAGGYFEVLGHPEGSGSQGVTRVSFKRDILLPILIPGFNRDYEDANVIVDNHSGSNLDGKISYGKFRPFGD